MKKSITLLAFLLMGLGAFAQSAQAVSIFRANLIGDNGWGFDRGSVKVFWGSDSDPRVTLSIRGLSHGAEARPSRVRLAISCRGTGVTEFNSRFTIKVWKPEIDGITTGKVKILRPAPGLKGVECQSPIIQVFRRTGNLNQNGTKEQERVAVDGANFE